MQQRGVFACGVMAGIVATALVAWTAWPSTGLGGAAAQRVVAAPDGEPLRQPSSPALPRVVAGAQEIAAPGVSAPSLPAATVASPASTPGAAARSAIGPGAAPSNASVPAVPAVALSAEHAAVLVGKRRPPTLQEQHADFAGQPKDPRHSQTLEAALRQAVDAGNASGEFEVMTVDCRMTLCEVLAFGNLPGSGERWNQLTEGMARQPWYAEHIRGESTSSAVQNNRYVIVTILQRKRPPV